VALVRTYVSEELITFIIRVTRIGELGTTLPGTSNRIHKIESLQSVSYRISSFLPVMKTAQHFGSAVFCSLVTNDITDNYVNTPTLHHSRLSSRADATFWKRKTVFVPEFVMLLLIPYSCRQSLPVLKAQGTSSHRTGPLLHCRASTGRAHYCPGYQLTSYQ
jgi:hypothetical protein